MKVVFLDIDGVLNNSGSRSGLALFDVSNIKALNQIIEKTTAKIVLSSSWRHNIGNDQLFSIDSFAWLLASHGIKQICNRLIDITPHDGRSDLVNNDRGFQCRQWLDMHCEAKKYIAIDDIEYDFEKYNIPLLKTDSMHGLTLEQAERAIQMLND